MLSLVMAVALASTAQWSCEDEDARVTQHLQDALIQLRSVAPPGLGDAQRTARFQLLEDLGRYIEAQQFPRATGVHGPVFVDDEDHHCAMGALLAWNGGGEIVQHIRATRNLATVPTLADEPGLAEWLTSHGMTVEEAALVQPAYFGCVATADFCWRRHSQPLWYANGSFLPDGGGQVSTRIASPDGQCAGDPFGYPWPGVAAGTLFSSNSLAVSGDRFVHLSWLQCRDPLLITRAALEQPTPADCARQMIADDPRALVRVCGDLSIGDPWVSRCASDGRFLSERLPTTEWVLGFQYEDAGVSLAVAAAVEAEAWAHSDDGGIVPAGDFATLLTWSGTNAATCVLHEDGGVENRKDGGASDLPLDAGAGTKPQPQGCSIGIGYATALAALLLRARRRRVTSAGTSPRP